MRIAFTGNFGASHCTEVHLAATMEAFGHDVTRIQENGVHHGDLVGLVAGHDMFFFVRTWGKTVTMEHLTEFRRRGITTVSYHLDLYVGLQREDGLDNDPFWYTDFVFSPDGSPEAAAVFAAKGINHHYMRPGVWLDECYMADIGHPPRRDVVFVGGGVDYGHSEWPYRARLVTWLADTYGARYHKFGYPEPTMRNDDLNRLYADSKVVVGDSVCLRPHAGKYWSDRVTESVGRGAFIIHPYIVGMDDEFIDGEHLRYYDYGDFAGLRSLIDYYLTHDDERERIRLAGHEFVKANATYHNRLDRMFAIVDGAEDDGNGGAPVRAATPARLPLPAPSAPEPATGPAPAAAKGINLHLGAGREPTAGWVNVDRLPEEGIQVVCDLGVFPWPWEDNSVSKIKAIDLLEHLPNYTADGRPAVVAFMEECHRILEPDGALRIQVPHWNGPWTWIDPTHVRGFDPLSFHYFDPDTEYGKTYGYYSTAKFRIVASTEQNHNITVTMRKR